jgi:hypothetical protein
MTHFKSGNSSALNSETNFNRSKEIAYWSKKYNIDPDIFQKLFQQSEYSISKTLLMINKK